MSLLRRKFSTVKPLQGTQLNSIKKRKIGKNKIQEKTLHMKKALISFQHFRVISKMTHDYIIKPHVQRVKKVVVWASAVASKC